MSQEGAKPDPVIFVESLNVPRCVEKQIIQSICESDVLVDDSLIDMWSKSGSKEDVWSGKMNKSWDGFEEHNPQDFYDSWYCKAQGDIF